MSSATTGFERGVRIHAAHLADAQRRAAAVRSADDDAPVLLDVEVLIAGDATSAFAALATAGISADTGEAIRYVGTPRGLASLIADVATLGIADGVVLKPLAGCRVEDLMLEALVPGLTSCLGTTTSESVPA